MKNLKLKILVLSSMLTVFTVFAQEHTEESQAQNSYPEPQPVLVEAMAGSKWGMLQSVFLKKITPESKVSIFNLTNYEKTYKKDEPANFIIQTLAYYQPVKNLHFGIGANLKAFGGFKPLLAAAYVYNSRNITLILQPSIELDKDGVGELFGLFEYRGAKGRKVEPFFSLQGSSSYYSKGWGHDYSYLNVRAGVEIKNFRFGPALNYRTFGKYSGEANFGGFLGLVIY